MATTKVKSSWIDQISYIPELPGYGVRIVVVFTKENGVWVYRGVPSNLPGLLVAGRTNTKGDDPHLSSGATFHRLLKGKYQEIYVKDKEVVQMIKQITKNT